MKPEGSISQKTAISCLKMKKEAYSQLTEAEMAQGGVYTMTEEMAAGLKTLFRLLFKQYGQKVILLIDEYDVPLDKAFQAGYYDEMVALIHNLFGNALKTNECLHFAVLTGCLRISKENIFTGLNNLNVMTISAPYFCDSFSFTEEEVMGLCTIMDWTIFGIQSVIGMTDTDLARSLFTVPGCDKICPDSAEKIKCGAGKLLGEYQWKRFDPPSAEKSEPDDAERC